MNNILTALIITTLTGLSTGVGSLIAFFAKNTNTKFLSLSLGFSAGVMIYVSMVELLTNAFQSLILYHGEKMGTFWGITAFFAGILLIAVIDKIIPDAENPHNVTSPLKAANAIQKEQKLMRTGTLTALAIGIHNFPEGMATFISAFQKPSVAIPIAVAIAIHNIPEGIAVSVPIYYASKSRKKAFFYSFLSGLAEPLGAIIGYLILMPFLNDSINGIVYSAVAGIMVFISFDELLPSAREYGEHHLSIYGLCTGMALMALSLWLFI